MNRFNDFANEIFRFLLPFYYSINSRICKERVCPYGQVAALSHSDIAPAHCDDATCSVTRPKGVSQGEAVIMHEVSSLSLAEHIVSKTKKQSCGLLLLLVPVAGVEPARYRYHRILSPARLPIPSHRHAFRIISHFLRFCKCFSRFYKNFLKIPNILEYVRTQTVFELRRKTNGKVYVSFL